MQLAGAVNLAIFLLLGSSLSLPVGALHHLTSRGVRRCGDRVRMAALAAAAASSKTARRVIIVPGNGCSNVRRANWYGWLEQVTRPWLEQQ